MIRNISLLALVMLVCGCGQTSRQFISRSADSTPVKFDVTLEKPFVSSISSIGGGQAAMILLVGPFTNNAVLLVAKTNLPTGETIAFRQRLKWGENSFEVPLRKNTKYQLVAVVQGTRSGIKEVGTIDVSPEDAQHFTVRLLENEVSIK
jgi:hypothetical protein